MAHAGRGERQGRRGSALGAKECSVFLLAGWGVQVSCRMPVLQGVQSEAVLAMVAGMCMSRAQRLCRGQHLCKGGPAMVQEQTE